jgi:hypothetical protein
MGLPNLILWFKFFFVFDKVAVKCVIILYRQGWSKSVFFFTTPANSGFKNLIWGLNLRTGRCDPHERPVFLEGVQGLLLKESVEFCFYKWRAVIHLRGEEPHYDLGSSLWGTSSIQCHTLLKTLLRGKSISSSAEYVTLSKYFSHPSLVMYYFATPPIKLGGGLLIANHLDITCYSWGVFENIRHPSISSTWPQEGYHCPTEEWV